MACRNGAAHHGVRLPNREPADGLGARRSYPTDAERLATLFGPGQSYLAAKPQRVVAVELAAALPDGYAAAAHAVIVLLPQDSQPYRVLVWKPLPSSMSR